MTLPTTLLFLSLKDTILNCLDLYRDISPRQYKLA
jgi:hypothetical protein